MVRLIIRTIRYKIFHAEVETMKIRIYDIENLPFGCQITVKTFNGSLENAVAIVGGIAFKDGIILSYEELGTMEIYLGWE